MTREYDRLWDELIELKADNELAGKRIEWTVQDAAEKAIRIQQLEAVRDAAEKTVSQAISECEQLQTEIPDDIVELEAALTAAENDNG